MASTTRSAAGRVSPDAGKHGKAQKHVHHGKTPAAWVGSMVALVAFLIGGIALVIGPNWVLFWIAVGLVVVGLIATKVLQRMGYGAD
ncbi:MAG: HGxxPAAW family protein [Actinomycetes bacterium]